MLRPCGRSTTRTRSASARRRTRLRSKSATTRSVAPPPSSILHSPFARTQKTFVPLPYESLPAFNRRVEIALRPTIDTAIRGAKASKKLAAEKAKKAFKAKKAALADPSLVADAATANKGKGKATAETSVDPLVPPVKVRNGRTEFAEASQVRSITDVAMAPPTLKKARRGAAPNASTSAPMPAGRMPVSDGLKKIMELEREKAVRMYREMKEKRDKEQREA